MNWCYSVGPSDESHAPSEGQGSRPQYRLFGLLSDQRVHSSSGASKDFGFHPRGIVGEHLFNVFSVHEKKG